MKPKHKKQLVISLIKDDLVNSRLVNRLNACGLRADDYLLQLRSSVFTLMGLPKSYLHDDEINDLYSEWMEKSHYIPVGSAREAFNGLAEDIYRELRGYRGKG